MVLLENHDKLWFWGLSKHAVMGLDRLQGWSISAADCLGYRIHLLVRFGPWSFDPISWLILGCVGQWIFAFWVGPMLTLSQARPRPLYPTCGNLWTPIKYLDPNRQHEHADLMHFTLYILGNFIGFIRECGLSPTYVHTTVVTCTTCEVRQLLAYPSVRMDS